MKARPAFFWMEFCHSWNKHMHRLYRIKSSSVFTIQQGKESFYYKYHVDNTQRKNLRNMHDSLSFLGEKLCKHRDVIVGWNRILSLERSYFPCPFQWQITEPCSQLLQAIPALGHLLSHNLLWKWLKSLNVRFTVGCTVFPVPSLRCKWKGKKRLQFKRGGKLKISKVFISKASEYANEGCMQIKESFECDHLKCSTINFNSQWIQKDTYCNAAFVAFMSKSWQRSSSYCVPGKLTLTSLHMGTCFCTLLLFLTHTGSCKSAQSDPAML